MSCGRTVTIWAKCDNCGDCMSYECENGSVKDAVTMARMNGWMVRSNGEVICLRCRQEVEHE